MGERLNGIQEVRGSIPLISTTVSEPAAWLGSDFLYICKNQGVRCLKADAFFILKAFAIAKYPAAVCGVMRVTHTRKACMAGISVSDRSKDRMAFHCGYR